MADGIAITKADGENVKATQQAKADAVNALHMQSSPAQWKPRVLTISSLENKGIAEMWRMILEHNAITTASGHFEETRNLQKRKWVEEVMDRQFKHLLNKPALVQKKEKLLKAIMEGDLLPSEAAHQLWNSIAGKV